MNKVSKLKRCPFCGIGMETTNNKYYFHPNNNCILHDFGIDIENRRSVKAWNTRKPMEIIVERLEALRTCSDFGTCNHCQNRRKKVNKINQLKKCPFCGGDDIQMSAFSISSDCYIICNTCGAVIEKSVPWNDMTQEEHDDECKKVLIEAWNTRKPMERILERLEEQAAFENVWDDETSCGAYNAYSHAIKIVQEEGD